MLADIDEVKEKKSGRFRKMFDKLREKAKKERYEDDQEVEQ
ncbi:hypothetical protein [Pontibacter sp. BAB1700]|nr:hypothetical protein [Pontibacter sp. BAB1700]